MATHVENTKFDTSDRPSAGTGCFACLEAGHFCAAKGWLGDRALCLDCGEGRPCSQNASVQALRESQLGAVVEEESHIAPCKVLDVKTLEPLPVVEEAHPWEAVKSTLSVENLRTKKRVKPAKVETVRAVGVVRRCVAHGCMKPLASWNKTDFCSAHQVVAAALVPRGTNGEGGGQDVTPLSVRTCSVPGCKNAIRSINQTGICKAHQRGELATPATRPKCRAAGCSERVKVNSMTGYCQKNHHKEDARERYALARAGVERRRCPADGCGVVLGNRNKSGLCGHHTGRTDKPISNEESKTMGGKGWQTSDETIRKVLADKTGDPLTTLAKRYGISPPTVKKIKDGKLAPAAPPAKAGNKPNAGIVLQQEQLAAAKAGHARPQGDELLATTTVSVPLSLVDNYLLRLPLEVKVRILEDQFAAEAVA